LDIFCYALSTAGTSTTSYWSGVWQYSEEEEEEEDAQDTMIAAVLATEAV